MIVVGVKVWEGVVCHDATTLVFECPAVWSRRGRVTTHTRIHAAGAPLTE